MIGAAGLRRLSEGIAASLADVPWAGRPVLRFAPSPNGLLHRGHAFSALLNQYLARAAGGRMLVRIEDIDTARCPEALVEAVIEDLDWLGIRSAEPVRRQSRHFADYGAAVDRLRARDLVYACHASRTEVSQAAGGRCDPDGAPLRWRDRPVLDAGEEDRRRQSGAPFSLRLDMRRAMEAIGADGGGPHASAKLAYSVLAYSVLAESGAVERRVADPARWGDVVLVRKDVPTSYHMAVVVDDALQKVSHVIRGCDLEAATDIHRLLQELLGLPVPVYHHHALLRDGTGDKLAKSRESQPLRALREAGVTAAQVRAFLGFEPFA